MEQNGATVVATISLEDKQDLIKQEREPTEEYREEEEEEEVEEEDDGAKEDEELTPRKSQGKNKRSAVAQYDSTDVFNEVFGDRREFDSWDAFTDYLEEFQAKSGTRFKPRSACKVDHVNERRIGSPIPERFVYAAIKMICVHYGEGGSGKRKNYVGKGCEAFMRVSYSKGAMRITQTQLLHTNHDLIYQDNHPSTRNFRVFNFTEELDNEIIREVLNTNPFEFKNGEKEWAQAVENLKGGDERFSSLTPRLIKKRTRLLLDNFSAISQGRKPSSEDEMGSMLFKLDKAKKHIKDEATFTPKTRKRRGRGRPRKASISEDELEFFQDDDNDADYVAPPPKKGKFKKTASPSTSNQSSNRSVSNGDISMLLSYLQKKDEEDRRQQHKEREEDRRLRQKEIEEEKKINQREAEEDRKLRQREIDLRREELLHQKERFEFEKGERKVHMDLLKSQLQVFEQSMLVKQPQQQAPSPQQTLMPLTLAQAPSQQPQPTLQQQQPQPTQQPTQAGDYTQFQYR